MHQAQKIISSEKHKLPYFERNTKGTGMMRLLLCSLLAERLLLCSLPPPPRPPPPSPSLFTPLVGADARRNSALAQNSALVQAWPGALDRKSYMPLSTTQATR